MHSDGEDLWLVTYNLQNKDARGQLWKYNDKKMFDPIQAFEQAPIALTSYKGAIAIGTYASSGGALWLFGTPQSRADSVIESVTLPHVAKPVELDTSLVQSLYDELFELVMDPQSTGNYARALRRQLASHPQIKTPEFGAALTKLLSVSTDGEPITMFNDQTISHQDLIRWYLVSALAINGHGRIDPSWFNPAGELTVPSSGKLFNPSIAAIVASGWLKQNDHATLAALFERLNNDFL